MAALVPIIVPGINFKVFPCHLLRVWAQTPIHSFIPTSAEFLELVCMRLKFLGNICLSWNYHHHAYRRVCGRGRYVAAFNKEVPLVQTSFNLGPRDKASESRLYLCTCGSQLSNFTTFSLADHTPPIDGRQHVVESFHPATNEMAKK